MYFQAGESSKGFLRQLHLLAHKALLRTRMIKWKRGIVDNGAINPYSAARPTTIRQRFSNDLSTFGVYAGAMKTTCTLDVSINSGRKLFASVYI